MIHCLNRLTFVVKDKKVQNVYQPMTTSQALSNNFKIALNLTILCRIY